MANYDHPFQINNCLFCLFCVVIYYPGSATVLWLMLWFLVIHDSPESHPRIDVKEKHFIRESIGDSAGDKDKVSVSALWFSMICDN